MKGKEEKEGGGSEGGERERDGQTEREHPNLLLKSTF